MVVVSLCLLNHFYRNKSTVQLQQGPTQGPDQSLLLPAFLLPSAPWEQHSEQGKPSPPTPPISSSGGGHHHTQMRPPTKSVSLVLILSLLHGYSGVSLRQVPSAPSWHMRGGECSKNHTGTHSLKPSFPTLIIKPSCTDQKQKQKITSGFDSKMKNWMKMINSRH